MILVDITSRVVGQSLMITLISPVLFKTVAAKIPGLLVCLFADLLFGGG